MGCIFFFLNDLSYSSTRGGAVNFHSRKLAPIGTWLNSSGSVLAKPIKSDYFPPPLIDDIKVNVMH